MTIYMQTAWLFLLAIPIACITWTVTHEEIFREPREYCRRKSKTGKTVLVRKLYYLLLCEYCFSHYITILFLIVTKYTLLLNDWRGYTIAVFSLVWIANIYMSLFGLLRRILKKRKQKLNVWKKRETLQY